MNTKPLRIRQYFSKSFQIFRAYPGHYMGIIGLTLVTGIITNLAPITSLLFNLCLLQPIIYGMYLFTNNHLNGETPLFMDFFGAFQKKKYISILLLTVGSQVFNIGLLILSALIIFQPEFSSGAILSQAGDMYAAQFLNARQPDFEMQQQAFVKSHVIDIIAMFLLFLVLFIPVFFTSWYASIGVIVRGSSLTESLGQSWRLMRAKPLSVLLLVIVSYLLLLAGFLMCLIGLIVAVPILQITWLLAFQDMESDDSRQGAFKG